ncbi:MAG: hypothetical protein AAF556_01710 [Pseudomonadota bacterium]
MTALIDMARDLNVGGNDSHQQGRQPTGTDGGKSVGLVVDIGADSLARMNPGDADAYLHHLGRQLSQMRADDIPVIWVQMNRQNGLHEVRPPPLEQAGQRHNDTNQLRALGFLRDGRAPHDTSALAIAHDEASQAKMDAFMAEHGPRAGDVVASKYFKSPFMRPEDYQGPHRAGLRAAVARDSNGDTYPLPKPGDFTGPDLLTHLREHGLTQPILMGGMSDHCIVQAAIDGRWKGLETSIASDLVVSWADPNANNDGTDAIIWRHGFTDPDAANAFHVGRVQDAISAAQDTAAIRDMPAEIATQLPSLLIAASDALVEAAQQSNPISIAKSSLKQRRTGNLADNQLPLLDGAAPERLGTKAV